MGVFGLSRGVDKDMNETHKDAVNPRKAFADQVAIIEAMPQAQRWRAIKKLLFSVKPELKALDRVFIAQVTEERSNMLNDLGASKSLSTRKLLSMPQYLYAALHVLDPEFTKQQDDPELSVKTNLKLAEVFPEYCLARKI